MAELIDRSTFSTHTEFVLRDEAGDRHKVLVHTDGTVEVIVREFEKTGDPADHTLVIPPGLGSLIGSILVDLAEDRGDD